MTEKTLAMNIKKVNKWGAGRAVFITKEANIFGWNEKTYVTVSAIRDDDGDKIVIKKIVIA